MASALFLGIPLTNEIEGLVAQCSAYERGLLLEDPLYLKKMHCDGICMLGKELALPLTFEELRLAEKHVMSLLKRLMPSGEFSHLEVALLPMYE